MIQHNICPRPPWVVYWLRYKINIERVPCSVLVTASDIEKRKIYQYDIQSSDDKSRAKPSNM
jgi:hypothetical protein